MLDAANDEHNIAGEASAQQKNAVSSSEHESSKPTDAPESSQRNESGSRTQKKPEDGFAKKGEATKFYLR
jgi:hypothetical protein